jgi:undecaprenyl-diphosphatase
MKVRVVAVAVVVVMFAAGAVLAAGVAGSDNANREAFPPVPQRHLSVLDAALLGVIEGLTEYLPVSSTGHLILMNHAMGLSSTDQAHPFTGGISKTPGVDAFDIVIQLGAILAVLGLYRRRVLKMLKGLVGQDPAGLRLLVCLVVAFLPAAVVGFLGHHWITEHLFNPMSVIIALAVGGVLMIVIEHVFWRRRPDVKRITDVCDVRLWQALIIGLAQVLAMWPGTSRSMITILAALVIGLDMIAAAEFSFLLALPTLGAATVYAGYKNWGDLTTYVGVDAMVVGLVVSGVVAALAVKGFVRWLSGHGLLPFGVYRIALAGALVAYFLATRA